MAHSEPTRSTNGTSQCQGNEMVSWEWVAEFLTLQDMLTSRVVCKEWNQSLEETLSPRQCGVWLSRRLMRENLYLTDNIGLWKDASNESIDMMASVLVHDNNSVSPVRTLIDTLRVVKVFPSQAAVAFSAPYGRHCIPLHWDDTIEAVVPTEYEACQRGEQACAGCRLVNRIPQRTVTRFRGDEATDDCMDDFYDILRGDTATATATAAAAGANIDANEYVELKKYYPSCTPNLPPDLICPVCRVSSERTLQLTEVSYASTEECSGWNTVTSSLTPVRDDTTINANTTQNAISRQQRNNSWRDQLYAADSFPPAPYRDVNIPIDHPPQRVANAKHCLAIHCDHCRQFGILAPVAVCGQGQFRCQDRLRYLNFGKDHRSLTGAVFVRQQCSHPNCNRPTLCHRCCRSNVHANDDTTGTNGLTTTMQSHCGTCHITFCTEHHWQSTCCHHW
jgi:hypothetical protein